MSSSFKYDFRLMNENDYDQVLYLLTNSFFQDEPLAHHLQVTNTLEFSKNVINGCLQDQCSFVAYNIETKQIVGICLNEIIKRNSQHEINEPDEKICIILNIFNDIQKNINIFDKLNANTLLHIFILGVDKIARGHGLASQLISKSIEYGQKFNIDGAYAEASNIYSLNCFKQQKFEIFNELIYSDYNPERLGNLKDKKCDRCYLVARKL